MNAPVERARNYPRVLRWLHWAVASLMLAMLAMGFSFAYVDEASGRLIGNWHVTLGMVLLPLAIAQLVAYSYLPRPNMLDYLSYDNYWFAKLAHFYLHYAAIALPVSGILMCAPMVELVGGVQLELPFQLSKTVRKTLYELHGTMAQFTAWVVGAHILGALKQHFWNKNSSLKRMTVGE